MIVMEALQVHTHYNDAGTEQLLHRPGDIYELHDGAGMTAEQLANSFVALGVAKRADVGAVLTADQELAPVGELPKPLPPRKKTK